MLWGANRLSHRGIERQTRPTWSRPLPLALLSGQLQPLSQTQTLLLCSRALAGSPVPPGQDPGRALAARSVGRWGLTDEGNGGPCGCQASSGKLSRCLLSRAGSSREQVQGRSTLGPHTGSLAEASLDAQAFAVKPLYQWLKMESHAVKPGFTP